MNLCQTLGHLPLGISLLSKKIYSLREQDLKQILNYLNQNILDKLNNQEIKIKQFFELNFQILTSVQQQIFISMAIFAGRDFSIESIASINDLKTIEANEIMEELFNRSLLEKTQNNRYILHPLIQLFLENKLTHHQLILKKCLQFYLNCYQQQGLREKIHNLQFFAQEIDNLISILDRFDFNQDWNLVKQLWEYFVLTLWDLGLWDKIISLSKKLSKIAKSKNDRLLLIHLYIRDLGILYFQRNEPQINQKNINEGLILATKLNHKFFIAYAHLRLGMIALQQKKLTPAIQQLKIALELFTELKENGRIGETLCYLAYAYFNQQNSKTVKQLVRQAYRACAQINHQRGQADALSYLAEFYFFEKDFQHAQLYFKKSLKIDEKIGRIGQIWIYNIAALAAMELMKVKSATKEQYLNKYLKYNQFAQTVWRVDKLQPYLNSSIST